MDWAPVALMAVLISEQTQGPKELLQRQEEEKMTKKIHNIYTFLFVCDGMAFSLDLDLFVRAALPSFFLHT